MQTAFRLVLVGGSNSNHMKNFIISLFATLSLSVLGQNQDRIVSTATELVNTDPSLFANSSPGTNTSFSAFVTTTGNTVAGEGTKRWQWSSASVASTNTYGNNGPLAYAGSPSTGRWLNFTSSKEQSLQTQIDNVESSLGGTNDVVVLESIAELVALTSTPKIVFLKAYNASYPTIGAGVWEYYASSVYPTNRAVVEAYGGAGRYLPHFYNSKIDIRRFGCRDGVVNDDGAHDAWDMQQDPTWPDKVFYVPFGNYHITTTLVQTAPNRVIIEGDQKATGYDGSLSLTSNSSSRITMDTANTPIITLGGQMPRIVGVSLWYNSIQTSANTSARAINIASQVDRGEFRNLHIGQAAYGFYAPSGVYIPNNLFDNIYVSYCSITAGYFAGSGTTMKIGHWYVQTIYGDATGTKTINSVSKSGTQITAVLSGIPQSVTTNCFVYVSGITVNGNTSIANEYKVVKSVSGNTITFDLTSDPGGSASVSGGTVFFGPHPMAGPAMLFGQGAEWAADSLDIENLVGPGAVALQNEGNGSVDNLHVEFVYSNDSNFRPIFNNGGTLDIQNLVQINQGAPTGRTGYLVYHSVSSGRTPSTRIGNMVVRDIATIGNTMYVAGRDASTTPEVHIGSYQPDSTARANATSTPAFNAATTSLRDYSIRSIESQPLSASTGTEIGHDFRYDLAQTGTAGNKGYSFAVNYTSLGSGAFYPFWLEANADPVFYISSTNYLQMGPAPGASKDHLEFLFNRGVDVKFTIGGSSIQTSDPLTGAAARTLNINTGSANSNVQIGSGSEGTGLRVGNSGVIMSRISTGTTTLVGGTATVGLGTVTSNTRIYLTVKTPGGTRGYLDAGTRTPSSGFTVNSTSASDTSTVEWIAIEP